MRKIKINRYSLYFALYTFIISLIFFQYYILGDQLYYIEFYNNVSSYNIIEGYKYYFSRLGASEIGYYLFVYILSPYVSKTIVFSIVNTVFAFFLAKGMLRLNVRPFILVLIGLNYYYIVLLFGAERLKFSLTFLIISFIVINRRKKIFFTLLSLLSHFQSIFLIQVKFTDLIINSVKSFFRQKMSKNFLKILFLLIVISLFVVLFRDAISNKMIAYMSKNYGITNILKPSLFCILSVIYARKDKSRVFFMQLPIIIGALLFGDARMTIMSFIVFLYFGFQYKRGCNFGVLVTLLYFLVQGIKFLGRVVEYGNGFDFG